MKNLFVVLFLMFVVFTSKSFAAPELTPPAVPANLHVYNIAGSTYVDHVAHGCSGKRYLLNAHHVKYDTIVSILLAAQIAGKDVVLLFDGCNTIPQGLITGVYLK